MGLLSKEMSLMRATTSPWKMYTTKETNPKINARRRGLKTGRKILYSLITIYMKDITHNLTRHGMVFPT